MSSGLATQAGNGNCYTGVTYQDKFFVHFFTRDCNAIAGLTDRACTTITTDMIPLSLVKFCSQSGEYLVLGSTTGLWLAFQKTEIRLRALTRTTKTSFRRVANQTARKQSVASYARL